MVKHIKTPDAKTYTKKSQLVGILGKQPAKKYNKDCDMDNNAEKKITNIKLKTKKFHNYFFYLYFDK